MPIQILFDIPNPNPIQVLSKNPNPNPNATNILNSNPGIISYVARTRQHGNGYDTWTHGKFLKIHMTRVPDTRVGHILDMT